MGTVETLNTVEEILAALERLPREERERIAGWIRKRDGYGTHAEEAARPIYADDPRLLTVESYLALEEKSAIRHEYVGGLMRAMSGSTQQHNLITGNLFSACRAHVKGGPCQVFMNDVKATLRVNDDDIYYYPDVVVTCDPRDRGNPNSLWVQHPTLVVEVLSPLTRSIDRREKFLNYRQIETLQEYVLVEQSSLEVTLYRRSASWAPEIIRSREDMAQFQSINLSLSLTEIYENTPLA